MAGARLMAVARRCWHKGSYKAACAGLSAYYVPHVPDIARIRGPAILARCTCTFLHVMFCCQVLGGRC